MAVIFGGKSGEHAVSLLSAISVLEAIDSQRFEVVPIQITKEGLWKTGKEALLALITEENSDQIDNIQAKLPNHVDSSSPDLSIATLEKNDIDVVFPVLHGTYGEDGTIQGLLEILDIPYVGAGVLSSAVAMDKVIAK